MDKGCTNSGGRASLGRKLVMYSLRVKREKIIVLQHIIAHL